MSADKRQDDPGREDPGAGLEDEFRVMFAERAQTVRVATAPYAAVRQRIAASRRKRRMRIGGAGVAFAVAVAGIGVWAAAPDRQHRAVAPGSHGAAQGMTATTTVLYSDGHTVIPDGPLRNAVLAWLNANYRGDVSGLTAVTTFDLTVEAEASDAAETKAFDGGVAIVDARDGAVLGLGGAWDRPLPIADLMKPLALAAAFSSRDYTPDSTVPLDVAKHPLYVPPGSKTPLMYMAPGGHMADWPPESPTAGIQDIDVTLREAAELGANGPFAQLELEPDVSAAMVRDVAVSLGMPADGQGLVPVPSLVLGTAQATPLTMATVYATLADGGVRHDPLMVRRLLAKDGSVLWTPPGKSEQVLLQSAAQQVTDVLHSALTDGSTGTAAEARTVADAGTWAMAGAADEAKAAWFDGGDSHYVVSVGASDPDQSGSLTPLAGESYGGPDVGSRIVGPTWAALVRALRERG